MPGRHNRGFGTGLTLVRYVVLRTSRAHATSPAQLSGSNWVFGLNDFRSRRRRHRVMWGRARYFPGVHRKTPSGRACTPSETARIITAAGGGRGGGRKHVGTRIQYLRANVSVYRVPGRQQKPRHARTRRTRDGFGAIEPRSVCVRKRQRIRSFFDASRPFESTHRVQKVSSSAPSRERPRNARVIPYVDMTIAETTTKIRRQKKKKQR